MGSYWTLTESEDLYEVHPFINGISYFILNPERKAYSYSDEWVNFNQGLQDAQWRFEGTSNAAGGYQIINAKTGETIKSGER